MGVTMNITKTNANVAPRKPRRLADAWPETIPRGMFVAALLERRLVHVARDEFPGSASPEKLAGLGEPVLVRADRASDEVEALLVMSRDSIVLIDSGYGNVRLEVAGSARAAVDEAAAVLRSALESAESEAGQVSVAFWMLGHRGGDVRHLQIEAPSFGTIARNYGAAVGEALEQLMAVRSPDQGRLILWRGEPGTGKSHALRALAREWAPWCSAHFIIDPEELFGRGGAYMLDVLTWDGDDADRWRLVILEDAGELIAADARTVAGQALSRLLNVTDGVLGQGARTLVLITTNEPVKRLHPATRRAGRCLADIEFAPLSIDEANAWLAVHGKGHRVDRPTALAKLYADPAHVPSTGDDSAPARFGFARALGDTDERTASARSSGAVHLPRPTGSFRGPRPTGLEHDELRLRIDRAGAGSHGVLASTGSAEAHGTFEFPFSETEVQEFMARAHGRGRIGSCALNDAKWFGGALFVALFREQVYGLYRDALAEARSKARGLRITLCLSGAPELVDVPWEYLFDTPDFLAISAYTPVVRYLDLPRSHRPLAVKPPLRILAVVSSPADYEPLDVERERANLERALSDLSQSGIVEVHWLEQPTLERLLRALQESAVHTLHYIGHGSQQRGSDSGVLLFEDDSGWARPITGELLGTVLHECESVRLAVLNSCECGRSGPGSPFAGMAASLVQRDIPAVVAMQSEITDNAAITFAEHFYSAIANGSPVDAAVCKARLAMFATHSENIEWGTPVLYMRVPNGRVFDVPEAPTGPGRLSLTK